MCARDMALPSDVFPQWANELKLGALSVAQLVALVIAVGAGRRAGALGVGAGAAPVSTRLARRQLRPGACVR